jgi:hypothetical protein
MIQQFEEFGCVARCVIKLAELKGHPITVDAFCEQFHDLFLTPEQYGLLQISQVSSVIQKLPLDLSPHFQTYRRCCAIEYQFNHEHRDVLVLSEIDLNQNARGLVNHCSLLRKINYQRFRLWIPWNNGSESERDFEVASWEAKACHGVVLLPPI